MSTRHWGLHGYTIKGYKDQLENALENLDAGDRRHAHVQSLIAMCDHHLTSKELRRERREAKREDLIEEWETKVVFDRIKVLLRDHPELAEWIDV